MRMVTVSGTTTIEMRVINPHTVIVKTWEMGAGLVAEATLGFNEGTKYYYTQVAAAIADRVDGTHVQPVLVSIPQI